MKPANANRVGDATQELSTLAPVDLGQTQNYESSIPPPHGSVGDTTRMLPQEAEPGATSNFVAGESSQAGGKMVGTPSSSGLRFRIVRAHARGGLGQVSVAEDLELHREVALKEILQRHAGNTESQARFVMEAEITGGLEHPGIVPVYGLGSYPDGRPFYAMRFIRGESLADTIEQFHEAAAERDAGKTAVEVRQLIGRFIDVCNAIEYAHSRGILHRDIKPANIMLGKYGETLVVDWGIAKVMNQPETVPVVEEGTLRPASASDTTATQMGSTVGTPQYMSPEQAAGRLDLLGPPSDVYSLGATLYFMLTGVPAFDGNRILELLRKVERGEFAPPRELNKLIAKPLNAICLKAMALEPEDRYASPRALADDLDHWLADEPVTAYRESASERAMRWLRHHRSWAQASLITLLAVTGVSIVAAVLVNQARRLEVIARTEAERQEALADESFQDARDAVDDFFTTVSETTLMDVPGMQPLRRELLEIAMAYEEQFLKLRGGDPALRRESAAATYRVARVTAEIKSLAEALPMYDRARRIQEELLTAQQEDGALRYALSNTYNEMGRANFKGSQFEEAQQWFQKSLDQRLWLVQREPKSTEYQRKLANTYMNVGLLASQGGRLDDALKNYAQANQVREELVRLDNLEPLFRRDLAMGRYNIGRLELYKGDLDKAAQSFQQAAQGFDELRRDYPFVTEYAKELGTCYRILADAHLQSQEYELAAKAYDKALDVQRPLAYGNPHVIEFAAGLAATYGDLAGLHERRNQFGLSLPLAEQAVEVLTRLVATNPKATQYRAHLASNLVRRGTLQHSLGDEPAALESLQQARDRYKAVLDDEPHNPAHSADKGTCLINLALVQVALAQPELARVTLNEACKIFEDLLKQYPDQTALNDDLARCYTDLGQLEETDGNLGAALKLYESVRKIHEQAGQSWQVVETLVRIAKAQFQDERPEEALKTYEQAREMAEGMIEPSGPTPAVSALLASLWHGRGAVLRAGDQQHEALAAYRQAVDHQRRALDAAADTLVWRHLLSQFYADQALVEHQTDQTAEAVATTLKRKQLWPDEPLELYRVGRDLAAMIPATGKDLSDTQRAELARQRELALDVLIEAKRAGYDDWQAAEKEDAFVPLRDQDAFQKLLAGDKP